MTAPTGWLDLLLAAMPRPSLLMAFALASLTLALIPGPAVLYIVTRTLVQGRAAGVASVTGVALGNFGNALAASAGLAALLAVSSLAFDVLRWAGAAYLFWLAWQALRRPGVAPQAGEPPAAAMPRTPPRTIFRDGALVALLNPKTTLFFAAFLPQFLDPSAPALAQSALLGTVFVAIALLTDSAYVGLASLAGPALRRAPRAARAGRLASAMVYAGLGLYAALGSARQSAPSR